MGRNPTTHHPGTFKALLGKKMEDDLKKRKRKMTLKK
jgi:hypothetical protein